MLKAIPTSIKAQNMKICDSEKRFNFILIIPYVIICILEGNGMKKKCFFSFITSITVLCVWVGGAWAALDEHNVREFLNTTGEDLIEALGEPDVLKKYEILDEIFEKKVDTHYIGQFALGTFYRRLTEAQKNQYHILFNRYIKNLYKAYPLDFETSDIHFEVVKISEKENLIEATVSVDVPKQFQTENFNKVYVDFNLKPYHNSFLIVDLKIGEVSMLLTLRKKLLQMIKDADNEISWFLEDFEDLVISGEKSLSCLFWQL